MKDIPFDVREVSQLVLEARIIGDTERLTLNEIAEHLGKWAARQFEPLELAYRVEDLGQIQDVYISLKGEETHIARLNKIERNTFQIRFSMGYGQRLVNGYRDTLRESES